MSVTYKCPTCEAKLRTPKRVPPGKSVTCPNCGEEFTPEPAEAAAGGPLKFADEPAKKPGKPESAKPEAAAAAKKKSPFADDDEESDESIKKGYGVVQETEEEKKEADKNKPKFTEVQDKFKKSARGPAQSLLVMPSNLLTGEGLLTVAVGILIFVYGMWPLVFNDAPPGEEELEESIATMLVGMVVFVWGALVCYGASHMQELGSYPWAMTGAVMGVAPLLVGIFGIVMLQNPKVKAGFAESTGGPDDEDEDDEDGEKAEGDDDEDDDEEGGGGGGGSTAKKTAKKLGKRLLSGLLSGGDDEEGDDGGDEAAEGDEADAEEEEEEEVAETEDEEADEDEDEGDEEEETPRKKRRKNRDDDE